LPGVYGEPLDKVPFGAAFGKGITMKMGQTNMHPDRSQLHHFAPRQAGEAPEMCKGVARQRAEWNQDCDRPMGRMETKTARRKFVSLRVVSAGVE
jgi:hypothetical protein